MGKAPEAIASYRRALKLNPEVAEAQDRFGTLLMSRGKHTEGLDCFRQSRSTPGISTPTSISAHCLVEGQIDKARATLEKAANLAPDRAAVYLALGNVLEVRGDRVGTTACYQKAARLDAQLAAAHYHVAMSRLAQGDFANGWAGFEWRQRCVAPRRTFNLPIWNGADLQGRKLLVHAEADAGDTLQFVRYVPLLERHGVEIALDVPESLAPLLAQSGFKNLVTGDPPAECAAQIPLLTLPGLVGTTLATIPANVPYLAVDASIATVGARTGVRQRVSHRRRMASGCWASASTIVPSRWASSTDWPRFPA